jgi:hypothetical protein
MATLKNTAINDTGHLTAASGTEAQRPASPVVGMVRYNSTGAVLEQYTANGWQGIEAPPTVSNFSGIINQDTDTTITITGSNFKSGSLVYVEGAATSNISRGLTTTFVSSTSLTATTNAASVNYVGAASFDIKVVNPSGLSAVLAAVGNVDRDPVWSTAAGSLGIVYDSLRTSRTFNLSASDPDGNTITYSTVSGSLPSGMSLNTSTGAITGNVGAVGSDTTYSFTIRASSTSGGLTSNVDRAFSILVKAPVITSYTATGGSTFTAPTGISSVEVLVIAGGAGGGGATGFEAGGGGGAGGFVYNASAPVTPGGSVPVNVGSGGASQNNTPNSGLNPASNGNPSAFGPITANGGGSGGGQYYGGQDGGSGGGRSGNSGQSIGSGTAGQGNNGGAGTNNLQFSAGGAGGGAGGAGGGASGTTGGTGGTGSANSISGSSITYAGGGGGAGSESGGAGGPGGSGGGGAGSSSYSGTATPGTTNRGGGGGGGCGPNGSPVSTGGPGIVIVKY